MNMDQLEGKWDQLKGKVREKWGKFTNDDITMIGGKKDQLLGKLQEHYGYTKEKAHEELGSFMKECNCASDKDVGTKTRPTL